MPLFVIATILFSVVKIGLIDSDRILSEYLGAREIKSQVDVEIDKFKSKALEMRQKIVTAKKDLEAQKLMLSETAKAAKLKEINDLEGELNRYLKQVYGSGGLAEKKHRELMTPIIKKINDAIEKIAESENLTIVLDLAGNTVAYAKEGMDITDLVIDDLNREYEPSIPGIGTRKILCTFPFYEGNRDAQDEDLGKYCQRTINNVIRSRFTKYRFIEHFTVQQVMSKRGITRNIEDRDAFDVARELNADYVILGTINKKIDRYEYEMRLGEVKGEKILLTSKNSTTKKDELQEFLATSLAEILKAIPEEE